MQFTRSRAEVLRSVGRCKRDMAEMCVKAVLAVADLGRRDVNLDLIKVPLLLCCCCCCCCCCLQSAWLTLQRQGLEEDSSARLHVTWHIRQPEQMLILHPMLCRWMARSGASWRTQGL